MWSATRLAEKSRDVLNVLYIWGIEASTEERTRLAHYLNALDAATRVVETDLQMIRDMEPTP